MALPTLSAVGWRQSPDSPKAACVVGLSGARMRPYGHGVIWSSTQLPPGLPKNVRVPEVSLLGAGDALSWAV